MNGAVLPTTTFAFDPDECFFADEDLDYAIVAVQSTGTEGRQLSGFGWNPLIEEEGKAIVAQWLNLIQHPNGETKQLGVRENQLLDVLDNFLHYETDTAPGSSGSPVYNDRWEVVALHHSGVWATNPAGQPLAIDGRVWREEMGEHRIKWIANEGARISKIVAHLRRQAMNAPQLRLLEEMFAASPPPLEGGSEGRLATGRYAACPDNCRRRRHRNVDNPSLRLRKVGWDRCIYLLAGAVRTGAVGRYAACGPGDAWRRGQRERDPRGRRT